MTDLVWVVSSCVMILAVLAVRAIFGKKLSAGFRYALWALVLLRLFIPGTVFQSPVSVETAVMKTGAAENLEAVKDYSSVERGSGGDALAYPRRERETAWVIKDVSSDKLESYQKTIEARGILNVVWVTGMGLMAAYLLYVNLRFYLKLRDRRTRIETDAPCRVYSVEGIESSCLFFNTIYVSKEVAGDPDRLGYVLAHELSHRRHGDGLFTLLRCAALVLHWYNPLVWIAAFASRQDSELFADAGAVKRLGEEKRESYGRNLIELSARPSVRASIACTATTMANNKRALKERVKNVATRRRTGMLVAAAVLAVSLAAVGCTFLGSAKTAGDVRVPSAAANAGGEPTQTPTQAPTQVPTHAPTQAPTARPTSAPTAAPDPEGKTDEWFIEEAWRLMNRIADVHVQQFDKDSAVVTRTGSDYVSVDFDSVSIPGQVYRVKMEKDERGSYRIWAVFTEIAENEAGEAYRELLNEADPYGKAAELRETRIVVTKADVRAYGCTAAVGTDEYREAIANCYMQKLVELYSREFDHLSPFRCYEVRGMHCGNDDDEDGASPSSYQIVIAFRTQDPLALTYLFDLIPEIYVNTKYSLDYYGWLSAWTSVEIVPAADGSWSCSAMLNGAAW